MSGIWRHLVVVGAVVVLGTGASAVGSAITPEITLWDDGSEVRIDLDEGAGMYYWQVDEVDHLKMQWFWFRTGAMDREEPVHTLPQMQYEQHNTNFDPRDDTGIVQYRPADDSFVVQMKFSLEGTVDNLKGDIAEQIEIVNTSGSPLELHFYQYCDFDLLGTLTDSSVEIINNGNTALQTEGPVVLSETVGTPNPGTHGHIEANVFNNTLLKLTNGTPDDLNDDPGPKVDADLTWAFQWDFVLDPDVSYVISKDKRLEVPEPGVASLLLAGGALALLRSRRRRRQAV